MSYEDASDTDLVARHARGEHGAFDEIVRRYETRVFTIAARMCGREDALDVAQEVFVNALRALRSFRGDAHLGTWFHRVAVNASLDHIRKRKRAPAPLTVVETRADTDPGPDDRAIAAARAADVRRALSDLSPDHRAVVVLDLAGADYSEIAEALGVPVGTVKSRMHRARIELAGLLGHLRTEPETSADPLRKRTP
ncbi:MAG: RNA polymerase sigma factor [Actinomycetota bacterium]